MTENNEILHPSDTEVTEEMHHQTSNHIRAKIHIPQMKVFS